MRRLIWKLRGLNLKAHGEWRGFNWYLWNPLDTRLWRRTFKRDALGWRFQFITFEVSFNGRRGVRPFRWNYGNKPLRAAA